MALLKSPSRRRLFNLLGRGEDAIVRGEQIIVGVTGITVTIAIFVQVWLRYIFYRPLFGLEELTIPVIAWFYFMGVAYSIYKDESIKADILPMLTKRQILLKRFKIASILLSMVAAGVLCYLSIEYCLWAAASHDVTSVYRFSTNYATAAVVAGGALMVFHLIIHLRREVKNLISLRSASKELKKKNH